MDNISAPQGGQAPQDGQPQGAGNMPDPSSSAAGQSMPGQPSTGDNSSLQMPPDMGGSADQGANSPQPPANPDPNQGQGQVEDVLEGTEGGASSSMGTQPDASGGLPNMGSAPDQAGEMPQDQPQAPNDGSMMPPGGEAGGQPEVTPQGQPDFAGSAGDGGMMPPDPNAVPGPQVPSGNAPQPKSGSKLLPIILIILVIVVLAGASIAYFMNMISLPFLDNLLGRNQQTTDQNASNQTDQTTNQFPEDQQRKNDLAQIKSALEEYFTDTQKYPISKEVSKISEATSVVYKALVPKYLEEMPADPAAPTKYYGYKSADGTSFELTAVLDNTGDSEGIKRGNYTFYVLTNNSTVDNQNTSDTTNQ